MKKQNLSISNFKSFGIFLVSLGILFVIVVFGINTILEKFVIFESEISGASKINRILKEENLNEVPIFGSSRANSSYVPSILGKNYWNYGIDGTHANVWLFFLEEELKKEKNTPILINLDLEGFQKSIGDINNYIPNSENKAVQKLVKDYSTELPKGIFRYFGRIESYTKYKLNESISLTKTMDNGGAFNTEPLTQRKFDLLVKQRNATKGAFLVNDTMFKKFIQLVESTQRKIFLVIAPYHSSYFNQFVNLETIEKYKEIIEQYPNCSVLDFSKFPMEDSLFINTSHLSYRGANIFSKELNKRLLEEN